MRRRQLLVTLGAGVTAGFAGCGTTGGSPENGDIGMSSTAFLPAEFEVDTGEAVVWANTSDRPHSVTAYGSAIPEVADYFASGGFDSEDAAREGWFDGMAGSIEVGETYSHTFEVAGEYQYFCIPHERGGMVGTIAVR